MGEVYRATDLILKRVVAIKLLPGGFAGRDIQRLQREARVLGSLSHAHLVRIFDFGSSDDGRPYLVMEFLEGQDLERLIRRAPLPLSEAREIASQILDGLAYMHSQGVVHRDLKPSNIFLVPAENYEENGDQIVKIIDLGLARLEETGTEKKDGQKLTRSGAVVGSPFYMSPEQVRSEAPDSRSDIYAFGCLLFAMIAGRPPFVSDNPMATFEMHLKATPPTLEQITGKIHPEGLEGLIATCLEKDPSKRFQSVEELKKALSLKEIDHKDPPPALPAASGRGRAQPLVLGLLALVTLALVFPLVGFLVFPRLEPENQKVAPQANEKTLPEEERSPVLLEDYYFGERESSRIVEYGDNGKHEYIQIQASPLADDGDIARLAEKPQIDRLILNNTSTDGTVLRKFAHLKISRIDLRKTPFSDRGARALLELPCLEEVDIGGCESLTDSGLATIARIPRLNGLTLGSHQITAPSFASLKGASRLEQITLSFRSQPPPAGFADYLKDLPRLRFIAFLACGKILPSDLASLKCLPHLEIVGLLKHSLDKSLLKAAGSLHIKALSVCDCKLDRGALLELRSAPFLEKVELSRCFYPDGTDITGDVRALFNTRPGFVIYLNGSRFSASQPAR